MRHNMLTAVRQVRMILVALALLCRTAALAGDPVAGDPVLDEFEDVKEWSTSVSEGASLEIAQDTGHTGMGMRLDFDFHGGGGYVIARKAFAVSLPPNYAFTFWMRAEATPNNFEFKLVDRAGENVWWYRQRDFNFPAEWQQITIKKRRLEFAWGPAGGGAPKRIAAIEFAVSAGAGGRGSVWIDELRLVEREPEDHPDLKPKVSASTSAPDHDPGFILDQDPQTSWRSGALAANQWVLIDFQRTREYGGLVIDWDPDDYATAYQVQVSDDGENWAPAYVTTLGNGGRDYVYMPDAESRYARLELQQSSRGQGYAIRDVAVKPFAFSASPNQFFEALAADAPPGTYPKYFSSQQTYWTVIGVNGDDKEGLLNEEGMLEVDKGAFSIEPFLYVDGALVTWNSVHTVQELERGYLPIPSVTWQHERVSLRVTAFAAGRPGASVLYARYRVANIADTNQTIALFLAIRPFQVLPPWQSLNMLGGVASVRDIAFDARTVWVNQEKAVISLTPPDHFGAAAFEEGLVTDFLREGKVPPRTQASDPLGYASAALQYHLNLPPGGSQDIDLAIPFHDPDVVARTATDETGAHVSAQLEETVRAWETMLGRVDVQLPPVDGQVARTLKSTLAYTLINRDGPAIQPGSRTYARSWIRDGAMTSAALLEMGFPEEVRDFIRWFAQHQFADGRIPCCIDRRGVDRVPEHDSNGEFIYAVAEYYRFTRDIGFLNEMWPAVVRAVEYIDSLRKQRMTDRFQQPDNQAFYGLLPESISHEGYSAHPVHSYWDDFFALRGLKDAVQLAVAVGDDERAARFAALRDAFQEDLYASLAMVMAGRAIDYIPASVELADFDPTSTAIALTLGSEQSHLPQPALQRTFDRYYAHVQERRQTVNGSDGYTPYELRNVGAFVRLGQRDRAFEILETMLADQRPPAWNQWQEIVWHDPRAPRFIGDMPHTWVGSGFIQSVRTMFAYEREADQALIIAAGLPAEWVMSQSGVAVKRLPTYYGVLNYTLRSEGANALRLRLSGDLAVPPGKIVLTPPLPRPLAAVRVNEKPIQTFAADSATIGEFPAEVVFEY